MTSLAVVALLVAQLSPAADQAAREIMVEDRPWEGVEPGKVLELCTLDGKLWRASRLGCADPVGWLACTRPDGATAAPCPKKESR